MVVCRPQRGEAKDGEPQVSFPIGDMVLPAVVVSAAVRFDDETPLDEDVGPTDSDKHGLQFARQASIANKQPENALLACLCTPINVISICANAWWER